MMAIGEGVKPSTFGFVDRCSIQLSYPTVLEVLPRVELGSQGFADLRITVLLKHHYPKKTTVIVPTSAP